MNGAKRSAQLKNSQNETIKKQATIERHLNYPIHFF
ncbi:hypothetical protein PRO82_000252 [Candidatus Protochlamydia amoebophila]|nr:hypothetical protein [Candidatus Protochlamydia amoebophila]